MFSNKLSKEIIFQLFIKKKKEREKFAGVDNNITTNKTKQTHSRGKKKN